jgi:SAM-dependent methyltransferase
MNPTKDPSIRSADRGRLEAEAPCHYDAKYFAQQSKTGWFRGWADLSKFGRYIGGDMKVIDFGCGGGFLLANISCREKIGIEINPAARAEAGRNGVRTVGSAGEIEDGWADLIVSNHALEHCREPLRELMDLLPKLAVGGMAVFVFPCESARTRYTADNRGHHLYSWSPMSAGNLFSEAGLDVVESKILFHYYPPWRIPQILRAVGGRFLYDAGCRIYGAMTYLNLTPAISSQVRVIAERNS